MKRKRYTDEQIVKILKEHESGAQVPDLSRRHGASKAYGLTPAEAVVANEMLWC